ncbi:MAG TPA: ImmA/IrrE family metallo-endopeptidase [Streptosporangiaceae bacterium]|nr:ImmA/IrrE family metallo-endopeptidase [Streptosporangiaceae bacterium]
MAKRAERAAEQLLVDHGITGPPVDPEALARADGIVVVRRRFKDGDVSGILFRDSDHHVIGVNSAHPAVRQRFTIAHELGHRALHPGRELILDVPVRVNLRDKTSSMASDLEEIEANAFAAALLMPEQMIRDQVNQLPPSQRREPDVTATALSKIFKVSVSALNFRLINLGLTS